MGCGFLLLSPPIDTSRFLFRQIACPSVRLLCPSSYSTPRCRLLWQNGLMSKFLSQATEARDRDGGVFSPDGAKVTSEAMLTFLVMRVTCSCSLCD